MPNITDFLEKANSNTNAILNLVKRFGRPELDLEISDLKVALASVKVAISELTDENRELKEKLRLLEFDKDNPLEFRNGMYYANGDDIPWCPHCYEVNHIRTHLAKDINFNNLHRYKCIHCDAEINSGEYRSPYPTYSPKNSP